MAYVWIFCVGQSSVSDRSIAFALLAFTNFNFRGLKTICVHVIGFWLLTQIPIIPLLHYSNSPLSSKAKNTALLWDKKFWTENVPPLSSKLLISLFIPALEAFSLEHSSRFWQYSALYGGYFLDQVHQRHLFCSYIIWGQCGLLTS